jgi:dihydroorotate dehydrogenase (NAD+) catalytic subunit
MDVIVGGGAAGVDLTTRLGPLHLANPIMTASGCFASGREVDRFADITTLGAVVAKSVTITPREGLPTPRMAETPSGLLNAIGLQNPGVDAWVDTDLEWLTARGATVVVSIAGDSVDDFRRVARRLRGHPGVAAVEVNLSCPNVEHRGLVFARDEGATREVVQAVRRESSVPVLAKLTADVTDVVAIARAAVESGATGLTLINTLLGMAIDPETGRPELANTYGGLSGPAIRPVALRVVHQVHAAMPEVPIVGVGGVRTVTDVVQFLRAGASAVAVGTATFVDPTTATGLVEGLAAWLVEHDIEHVSDLIGTVRPWR